MKSRDYSGRNGTSGHLSKLQKLHAITKYIYMYEISFVSISYVIKHRYFIICIVHVHIYIFTTYAVSMPFFPLIYSQIVLGLGPRSRVDSPLLHRRKRTFGVSPEGVETRNGGGWRAASGGWLNKEQK